jgi:hypothetical protein
MGLNIYCFVELQDKDGKRHFHEEINTDRDEIMYARIAGVRGPSDGFATKGFPGGVTTEVMQQYGGFNAQGGCGFDCLC